MNDASLENEVWPTADRATPSRAVAVLRIRDTSDRLASGWVAMALAERLRRELGSGGPLRLLPTRDVSRAQATLALPSGQALAEAELRRVRAQLGADLVVSASCRRLEDLEGTALELVARVQDARTGALVAHVHSVGPDDTAAVSRAVAEALRKQLGVSRPPPLGAARRSTAEERRRIVRRGAHRSSVRQDARQATTTS